MECAIMEKIVEGLPVVAEIPSEFDSFKKFIEDAEIPHEDISFQDLYRTGHDDVENAKRYMLHDINSLIEGIMEHATIDTYARKIYLTKRARYMCRILIQVLWRIP